MAHLWVVDDASPSDDIEARAVNIMRELGEVIEGTQSADVQVTALSQTMGWVVRGNVSGMYVYVQPEELENDNPNDVDVVRARHPTA